jgi:hypothetical protein
MSEKLVYDILLGRDTLKKGIKEDITLSNKLSRSIGKGFGGAGKAISAIAPAAFAATAGIAAIGAATVKTTSDALEFENALIGLL